MLVYGKYEYFVLPMFVSCVHPVAVLNAGLGCKRRPYKRGILQSRSQDCPIGIISFCLPHPVAVSVFIICGLCTCIEML